ncbi:LysR family transcriptional regulator [Paraburkholderia sp. J12]|uniref:LysR family transcriptional regulator n=1 Tax=Paraburkholderia sp. J12 TaxID=2805432 RepID=UPI002ABE7898|nr:LysR family transcriptional regulator [Paraburkholderia sp. J12]
MNYYAAIRAFLVTSEVGSFNIAAKKLSIKASTVSRYISGLERDVGGTLFDRSTHGVVLTERGVAFRGVVQIAVKELDEARNAVSALRKREAVSS